MYPSRLSDYLMTDMLIEGDRGMERRRGLVCGTAHTQCSPLNYIYEGL
jgi:hypothetical protein